MLDIVPSNRFKKDLKLASGTLHHGTLYVSHFTTI